MTLAAEDHFLLACARPTLAETDVNRAARAVKEGLDWDYVVDASIRHAVAPLVANALDQFSAQPSLAGMIPAPVRTELARLLEHSRERNARLFATIADIVALFHEHGIPVLGLKDVDLAVTVYPDRALRPMGDVDLLVTREDWDAATACLVQLGFEPQPGTEQPFADTYAVGQQFRRPSDETWVDLQWHVAEREWDRFGEGRFTFDTEGLWARAVALPVDGEELLAPCPADMLVHLCLHVEGHEYCELVLFSDIVAFLDRYRDSLDWDRLVRGSAETGTASSVYHVLLLTQQLFDVALPDGVLDGLRPAYFRGNLNLPLYGNLGSLHHALDDLYPVATSVPALPPQFESLVREQAARAMALEAQLDDLAQEFASLGAGAGAGAGVIVFDGSASARQFPDPAIAPFSEIELFIATEGRDQLWEAAARQGFDVRAEAGVATRRTAIRSADPVLAGRDVDLVVELAISSDVGAALGAGSTSASNRRAAARSLQRHLRRVPDGDVVHLKVHALSRTEILLCLASRLGRRLDGQLFGACSALDVLRPENRSRIDAAELVRLANRYGVAGATAVGMSTLEGIWGSGMVPAVPPGLSAAPVRVLTWARYGPGSLDRHPELRSAYLWALCLMVPSSASTRIAFLRRSVAGGGGVAPSLPPIVARVVTGTLGRLKREPATANELAYWARPSPSQGSAA